MTNNQWVFRFEGLGEEKYIWHVKTMDERATSRAAFPDPDVVRVASGNKEGNPAFLTYLCGTLRPEML
ncbi:hypothetical protein E5288_WYG015364 [Bos mutus]|uniref:Uncharacterized protein n=1 Tax=Bos mutus TaxID=72004 RepID=A0A6B0RD59_9CETA|nr:hypothetical protein [Bos mutus]